METRELSKPIPLELLVKQKMSSLILQKQTSYTSSVSAEAKKLSDSYSPSQITMAYNTSLQSEIMGACKTIDECAKFDSPMLCTLVMAYDIEQGQQQEQEQQEQEEISTAVTFVYAHLLEVNIFMGVRGKTNDRQTLSLAKQIIAEYPRMTMIEFILFCARFRSGYYESCYGCIDPTLIMKSLRKFQSDRQLDYTYKEYRDKNEKRNKRYGVMEKVKVTTEQLQNMVESGKLPFLKKILKF